MFQLINDESGKTISVRRESDGAFIPIDDQNGDYLAFLAWRAEGNEPEVIEL
jgi:hypothetical protein